MRRRDITEQMWERAKRELFARMLAYAHSDTGPELTYQVVSEAVDAWPLSHRSGHLYSLLDEIDREHFAVAGCLVSAVVTKSGRSIPGGGFFALAAHLGLYSASSVVPAIQFGREQRICAIDYLRTLPLPSTN